MNQQQISLFGSKKTDHWQTPAYIKELLGVTDWFDPCPRHPAQDGLLVDWREKTFVNPPYSQVSKWFAKAHEELQSGPRKVIRFLVFANTDTKWFHKYCYGQYDYCTVQVEFLLGRIKFVGDNGVSNSAMRPSMVVTFTSK